MLKIRLQRTGRKNDPHFRLIVTESTLKPKTSQFAEIVGTYNVKAGIFEAKADRVKHWMSVGAQATPTALRKQNKRSSKENPAEERS
jgi:small subunit ribosomal protein S16